MKDAVSKSYAACTNAANNLSKSLGGRVDSVYATGSTINREVKQHRDKLRQAWSKYEKAVQERNKYEFTDRPISRDPFIPCRIYASEYSNGASMQSQQKYRRDMTALYVEMRLEDERRIESTKALLYEHLTTQRDMLTKALKRCDEAMEAVTKIDATSDMKEFVKAAQLVPSEEEMKRANVLDGMCRRD